MPFPPITLLEMRASRSQLKSLTNWHAAAMGFQSPPAQHGPRHDPGGRMLTNGPLRMLVGESRKGSIGGIEIVGCRVPCARTAYEHALANGAAPAEPWHETGWSPLLVRPAPSIRLPGRGRCIFLEEGDTDLETDGTASAEWECSIDHLAFVTGPGEAEGWARLLQAITSGEVLESDIGEGARDTPSSSGRMFQVRPAGATAYVFVEPKNHGEVRGQLEIFLETNEGPGLQHVAFATKDIHEASRRMRAAGTRLVQPSEEYYAQLLARGMLPHVVAALNDGALIHDATIASPLWQFFTAPVAPNGLFYEFIQTTERPARLRHTNVETLFRALGRRFPTGGNRRGIA